MKRILEMIGYTDEISYREKTLYVFLLCVILTAGMFLGIYFFFVPFWPAMLVHIIYISLTVLMYIPLKYRNYTLVRYFLIISHLIQLTLAVYLWFPVATGFNNYYFLVPMVSYLIMDYGDPRQRRFAIVTSLLASALYLFSQISVMDNYIYQTSDLINHVFMTISIVNILIPMTIIFTRSSRDLYETQMQLRYLANTDALTKIKNRRSMYDTGNYQFFMARKHDHEFTVLLLDIDFFKGVNDSYGHPAGDELLRQFTEAITRNIRETDSFYRYGGEEFVLILDRTRKVDAYRIAEKLLDIIRDMDFELVGNNIRITVSAGLVQYSDNFRDFDQMIMYADNALYKAKREGRDRIVVAEIPDREMLFE